MTELDQRGSPYYAGLDITPDYLGHQLYLLGCIVHAGSRIDDLGTHALAALREQFQEAEIGRVLLTIAVAVRTSMDQNPRRAAERLDRVGDDIGTLEYLNESRTTARLQIRDACNKLMHCKVLNFDYVDEWAGRGAALNPIVYAYGSLREVEWKASIDLNKLIHVAFVFT